MRNHYTTCIRTVVNAPSGITELPTHACKFKIINKIKSKMNTAAETKIFNIINFPSLLGNLLKGEIETLYLE